MSGPPQLIFDDGSRIMAEAEEVEEERQQQQITDNQTATTTTPTLRGTIPLDTYYEINRISYEIIQKLIVNVDSSSDPLSSSSGREGDGYDNVKQQVTKEETTTPVDGTNGPKILRIALQFPDELLIDSPDVCWLLEDQIKLDILKLDLDTAYNNSNSKCILPFCFVLGDTTVNSCCPDEVAAYHLNATILIHYGHACLSPTSNLPIIYSFGKRLFNIENAIQEFEIERRRLKKNQIQQQNEESNDNEKKKKGNKFLILYQVGYHHAMEELQDQWMMKVNEGANVDDSDDENSFLVVAAEIPVPSQQKQSQLQRKRLLKKKKSSSSCCSSSSRQQSDTSDTETATTTVTAATITCCQQSDDTDTDNTATTITTNDDGDGGGGRGCCGNNNSTNNNACNRSSDDDPLLDVSVPENDNENESEDNSDDNNLDNEGSASSSSSVPSSLVLGGLVLPSKHFQTWNQLQDYTIIFIMANPKKDMDYCLDDITTPQQRQYANTMLCLLSLPNSSDNISHWIYSPETETTAIEETEVVDNKKPPPSSLMTNIQPSTSIQRQLNRRYYLIQKAKDSQTFGILVSNLSQQYLVDVVKSIQHLLKNNDKSSYTFAVGKINPNKLANFAEIDMFVLVACQENSLLDKERNEYGATPVITPYELQISLGIKEWGGGSNSNTHNIEQQGQQQEIYSLNCQDIIVDTNTNGGGGGIEQQHQDDNINNSNGDDDNNINDDSDAPYFSMITGKYVSSSRKNTTTNLDLINLPGKGQVMEYNSTASEFLKKREYQGLKSNIGKTNIEIATKGLNGIASDYSSNSKYKYK